MGICSSKNASQGKQVSSEKDGGKEKESRRDSKLAQLKAILLIQNWCRRRMARIAVERKRTWQLLTELENRGERECLELGSFYKALLENEQKVKLRRNSMMLVKLNKSFASKQEQRLGNDKSVLMEYTTDDYILPPPETYAGFRFDKHITLEDIERLIHLLAGNRHLSIRGILDHYYLLKILRSACLILHEEPNVVSVKTSPHADSRVTVVGDIHGQLRDLLTIFKKNGLPSETNKYIFNGDFVDRGEKGFEVSVIYFALKLMAPNSVYITRGNHEEMFMNEHYGFRDELVNKYPASRRKEDVILKYLPKFFGEIFGCIPLAAVLDDSYFIVHGGISGCTQYQKISDIQKVDRFVVGRSGRRQIGLLDPPDEQVVGGPKWYTKDQLHRRVVQDLLWSDPLTNKAKREERIKVNNRGFAFNTKRQMGGYYTQKAVENFLKTNNLKMLIRSHDARDEGFDEIFDGKMVTLFSASNYYGIDEEGNDGAFMVHQGGKYVYHRYRNQTQLTTSINGGLSTKLKFKSSESVKKSSEAAIKQLRLAITENLKDLEDAFKIEDPENKGILPRFKWADVMKEVTGLHVTWLSMASALHVVDENGNVDYQKFISNHAVESSVSTEINQDVFYKFFANRRAVQRVFINFDEDEDGKLTVDEFKAGIRFLNTHLSEPINEADSMKFFAEIDINKDGVLSIKEFLGGFTLVGHKEINADPVLV